MIYLLHLEESVFVSKSRGQRSQPVALAPGVQFAVNDTWVVWRSAVSDGQGGWIISLNRAKPLGGPSETFWTANAYYPGNAPTMDSENVYLGFDYAINVIPLDGSGRWTLASDQTPVEAFAQDATHVYWLSNTLPILLQRAAKQ